MTPVRTRKALTSPAAAGMEQPFTSPDDDGVVVLMADQ